MSGATGTTVPVTEIIEIVVISGGMVSEVSELDVSMDVISLMDRGDSDTTGFVEVEAEKEKRDAEAFVKVVDIGG